MRTRHAAFLAAAFLAMPALSLPVLAQVITCTECGMKSEQASRFTAKIVRSDKILYFCDTGDLFAYLIKNKLEQASAAVKDFKTGEWLDPQKAFYVQDAKRFKSPMSWGIASFQNKNAAAAYGTVMDFEGALKAVR